MLNTEGETYTMTDEAVQLEPASEIHRASGFAAKLTVGGRGALLTESALRQLVEHGGKILRPAGGGTITTADVSTRR